MAFFGEGAANQGAFHESLNLAALWNLPAVFVCEDNGYAISVEKRQATAVGSNASRAKAYDMPGISVPTERCEGRSSAPPARPSSRRARAAGPPSSKSRPTALIGHFQGDAEVYRPKGEVEALRRQDGIASLATYMHEQGILPPDRDAAARASAQARVAEAFEFARKSEYPAAAACLPACVCLNREEMKMRVESTHAHHGASRSPRPSARRWSATTRSS